MICGSEALTDLQLYRNISLFFMKRSVPGRIGISGHDSPFRKRLVRNFNVIRFVAAEILSRMGNVPIFVFSDI